MHFLKLFKLGKQWKSKMDECKVQTENKLFQELQNISEKISDCISDRNFESIIPLEKQRLKILQSFHVKPSYSGIKLIQNILEKNRENINIIENEKVKLNSNFKKVKKIFLAYGK